MVDLPTIYGRHAREFDRVRAGSTMEAAYLERAAALAPPPGTVLDLGCGTGEPIGRWFLDRGYEVTGVDAAGEMLDIAGARLPRASGLRADMRGLDLGERFDVVVAWDSFFHLGCDAQRAMFETFRRHAARRGALLFTSGTNEAEGVGGDLFGDVLYHASLDTAEYARLLDRHGVRGHAPRPSKTRRAVDTRSGSRGSHDTARVIRSCCRTRHRLPEIGSPSIREAETAAGT